METQASSRVSSAWTETSACRRQGQPSLSQEEGTGVRGQSYPLPRLFGRRNPAGCLLGLLGGQRDKWQTRKAETCTMDVTDGSPQLPEIPETTSSLHPRT